MSSTQQQPVLDFYRFPPVGPEDWRYAFATAKVRALETQMLSRTTLADMANAPDFAQAVEFLTAGEYGLAQGSSFEQIEEVLRRQRSAVRRLFARLMVDKAVVELFRTRSDFANLRLALRRTLTGKAPGSDYSEDGNVPAELLAETFEQDNYDVLPDYLQEAAEQAVLGYYQDKQIPPIDHGIDRVQAEYNLRRATELKNVFLVGLFKTQTDLTNIRTMLRLKFTGSERRDVFPSGGYVEPERFARGQDTGYEAIGSLFFATPYHSLVETSINYLSSENSFLRLEQQCDEHVLSFLKEAMQVAAGPQPVIAYLLMKELEIRTLRLLLTAKQNSLETKLILDRMGR